MYERLRIKEIEGLKKAKAILSGAKFIQYTEWVMNVYYNIWWKKLTGAHLAQITLRDLAQGVLREVLRGNLARNGSF